MDEFTGPLRDGIYDARVEQHRPQLQNSFFCRNVLSRSELVASSKTTSSAARNPRRDSAAQVPEGINSKIAIARSARDKGKEQQRTGLQGFSTQGYGVRVNRKPMDATQESGTMLPRFAERQNPGLKPHEPPRTTRYSPDTGPVGSVTEPDR